VVLPRTPPAPPMPPDWPPGSMVIVMQPARDGRSALQLMAGTAALAVVVGTSEQLAQIAGAMAADFLSGPLGSIFSA
jgi:hypothetical protein